MVDPKLVLSYGLIWGMVLIGILTLPILRYSLNSTSSSNYENNFERIRSITLLFLIATAVIVVVILEPLMFRLINHEPFLWTFGYISDLNSDRPYMIVYWIFIICCAIWYIIVLENFNGIRFANVYIYSTNLKLDDNPKNSEFHSRIIDLRRKYFHFISMCLFIPAFYFKEVTTKSY